MGDDDHQQTTNNETHFISSQQQQHTRPTNPEDECHCGAARCQEIVLSRELDTILNPRLIFHSPLEWETIWPLLTNRQMPPDTYLTYLAEFRADRHCGLVWPANQIAYRCRTCSRSPSMSLCCDCFRAGNHDGHDYNMFKSRVGGACDCGSSFVNEDGHCSRHGKNATAKRANEQVPESIICVPRRSLPRLIHRLAIGLRRSHVDIGGEIDIYIDSLIRLANSSAILRDMMIDTLISEQIYSSQIQLLSNHPDKEVSKCINEGLKKLKRERKGLISFKLPDNWTSNPIHDINAFCDNITLTSFLDEFIFWTVLFEFPQKLICFLLGFLMDDRYKDVFARSFVSYYPRIVMMLASIRGETTPRRNSKDTYEQLSRRMAQISAQIYNDAYLTKTLCEKEHTLHTIIYCLKVALEGLPTGNLRGVLELNPIQLMSPYPQETPMVVSHDNLIIRDGHLVIFTQDLNSILDFEHEAKRLISDKNLLNTWVAMLSYFQTMSPYQREFYEHTPYETGPQVSLFSIEADFCLSPLWSILNHLKDDSSLPLTQQLLESIHENLLIWFREMLIQPTTRLDPHHISFHIPLHRMFAATLRHMMFNQNRGDQEVYDFLASNQSMFERKYAGTFYRHRSDTPIEPPTIKSFIRMLLLHPLQTQTICYETRSSMWTRNGLMTAHQAVTYVHCAYCYSTIDLDMFLLRYCASKLSPDYFLKVLLSRFRAWRWLSFKSNILMNFGTTANSRRYSADILPEQIIQMVENSLAVIIQLLTLSIHCNISEREQTKQELIALISVRDRSYSYLLDMLPAKSIYSRAEIDENFESLLDELTIYKPPQHGSVGNLQQGFYTLKPQVWDEEYNPIQVLYRFNLKRDYQMSLDRYFQHCKLTDKLENRYHRSALWPPLKIPRNIGNFGQLDISPLIECPTLVGIVFATIYKTLYISEVPDTIMAYTIHLLELSLRKCFESRDAKAKQKPKDHSSFIGNYSHSELTSSLVYDPYNNGGNHVKGCKIYAWFNKQYDEVINLEETHRLFPVVRHALDLAFDTTWFPFDSILDNSIVHIENVHSMSAQEFGDFLKCPMNDDDPRSDQQANFNEGDIEMTWIADSDGSTRSSDSDDEIMEAYELDGRDDDDDDDNEDDDDDDDGDDEDDYGPHDEFDSIDASLTPREVAGNTAAAYVPQRPVLIQDSQASSARSSSIRSATSSSTPRTTTTTIAPQPTTAGDHTYSVSVDSAMEVESLPESQSSALSLLPVHNRSNRPERPSLSAPPSQQIYPENLVTERRAILASDPRPMLTSSEQPLALEAPPGSRSSATIDPNRLLQQHQQTTAGGSGNEERLSLSEVDIQARFMPFFQSRVEQQSPRARTCRPRQVARRGGHRPGTGSGHPMPPYAVHNPNNIQSTAPIRSPIPPLAAAAGSVYQPTPASSHLTYNWNFNILYGLPIAAPPNYTTNTSSPLGNQFSIELPVYRESVEQRRPQTARRSNACTLLNRVLQSRLDQHNQQQQHQQQTRDLSLAQRRKDRAHHGESLLSLLIRLHAKYSQRTRSYEFNEERAKVNVLTERSRVGDNIHFVTIVLDLICTMDETAIVRLEHLKNLIWGDKVKKEGPPGLRQEEKMDQSMDCDNIDNRTTNQFGDSMDLSRQSTSSVTQASSSHRRPSENRAKSSVAASLGATLDPVERRRRAKEFQSKLMAEFAKKQMAFIENYESLSQQQPTAHSKITKSTTTAPRSSSDKVELIAATTASASASTSTSLGDEEPINLSSKLTRETKPQQQQQHQHPMSDHDKLQVQQKQQLTPPNDKGSSGIECSGVASGSTVHDTLTSSSNAKFDGVFGVRSKAANHSAATTVSATETICSTTAAAETNDDDVNNTSSSYTVPIYECCICGVEGPSDLTNPLGQVVLLQSTSVYGHLQLRPQCERQLPCDESLYMKLREETYAKYLERRIDLLCEHFSESSWLDSINIGAEGGVHVQSCGHYLHIECHQSYIKSLDQERPRFRSDSDEFLCPVCRQLANSVLPILSDIRRPGKQSLAIIQSGDLNEQIKLIDALLERRLPPDQKELQSSAAFCAHLTKATGPQYRLVRSNASMHSLFLFLTSIARTNLETEVIVRSTTLSEGAQTEINEPIASGSSSSTTTARTTTSTTTTTTTTSNTLNTSSSSSSAAASKRGCFMLLFHVLALNAQTLINDQWFTCDQIWSYLTHRIDEKNRLSVKPMNSEVPLLLRDPTSILLQFLFAITNSLCYQANFTCLVQILFNLTVIQSIALVLSYVKPAFLFRQTKTEHEAASGGAANTSSGDNLRFAASGASSTTAGDFEQLATLVGANLAQLLAPTNEEPLMNSSVRDCWLRFAKTAARGRRDNICDRTASSSSSIVGGTIKKQQQQQHKPHEYSQPEEEDDDDDDDEKPISFVENRVKLACLPFLKAAAFIQHHLYDQTYPRLEIVDDDRLTDHLAIDTDFSTLTSFLKLDAIEMESGCSNNNNNRSRQERSKSSSAVVRALNWPKATSSDGDDDDDMAEAGTPQRHDLIFGGRKLIASWSAELLKFGCEFSIAARSLLVCRSIGWYRPSLMQLPRFFDDIFMFYYRKECTLCHQVPRDLAICLVCGAPICFRLSCCKDRSRSRMVHSQHCGANTAVFLAVHTSSIVVIRGNRACVWGSVYLDAHGEEDNGLQRGKPLYLVPARFQLLERQWLTHAFDHKYSKPWIYLHENQAM